MLPLAILGLGIQELVVILLLVVFIFGARKIPEVAKGLGEGIRGFRSSLRGDEEKSNSSDDANNVTDGDGK